MFTSGPRYSGDPHFVVVVGRTVGVDNFIIFPSYFVVIHVWVPVCFVLCEFRHSIIKKFKLFIWK